MQQASGRDQIARRSPTSQPVVSKSNGAGDRRQDRQLTDSPITGPV